MSRDWNKPFHLGVTFSNIDFRCDLFNFISEFSNINLLCIYLLHANSYIYSFN